LYNFGLIILCGGATDLGHCWGGGLLGNEIFVPLSKGTLTDSTYFYIRKKIFEKF